MENNISQYPELIKILTQIGNQVKKTYKQDLKNANKIASGKLYNSIGFSIKTTDTGIMLFFEAEKYWINIEEGRRVGGKMPPVEVIKRWMIIKNIQPRNGSNNSTAYLISRSISKRGIKALPFLRNIKVDLDNYIDDIKSAITRDLTIKIQTKLSNIKGNKYIQFKHK